MCLTALSGNLLFNELTITYCSLSAAFFCVFKLSLYFDLTATKNKRIVENLVNVKSDDFFINASYKNAHTATAAAIPSKFSLKKIAILFITSFSLCLPGQQKQHCHADSNSVFYLVKDDGLFTIGYIAGNFHTPVNRPRMHHDDLLIQ